MANSDHQLQKHLPIHLTSNLHIALLGAAERSLDRQDLSLIEWAVKILPLNSGDVIGLHPWHQRHSGGGTKYYSVLSIR
jgi:hypothetical protein